MADFADYPDMESNIRPQGMIGVVEGRLNTQWVSVQISLTWNLILDRKE